MDTLSASLVLVALCALVGVLAFLIKRRDSRVRRTATPPEHTPDRVTHRINGVSHTVVLFTTDYCGKCPSVRRMISEELDAFAPDHPVRPVWQEINLSTTPEIAQQHRISRTPTVIIFDHTQQETARFTGAVPATTFRGELYAQLGVAA